MSIVDLIKQSGKETAAFAKKNSKSYAVICDLRAARDQCKTSEAAGMITALLTPLDKTLRKETDTYNKKMSGIWKASKGEKLSKEDQKKLDDILKKSTDSMKSKDGKKPGFNSRHFEMIWINPDDYR